MKRIALLVFFTQSMLGWAQENYLVTSKGDTLTGKITFQKPSDYKELISVKTEDGNRTVSSNEMVVCYFKGDEYRSVRYGSKYRVMRVEIAGYLSLYSFRSDDSFEFATKYLNKKTQEGVEVSSIGFKKRMISFFEDCPSLVGAIDNRTYRLSDLEKIVDYYNDNCVEKLDAPVPTQVESSTPFEVSELSELQLLLKDLIERKNNNETIPKYLVDALASFTEKDVNLMLEELLQELRKE